MAGIKEYDAADVLDDDATTGDDPDTMPDDEVDAASLVLANAAGVGKEAKVAQIIRNLVRKEVETLLRQKTVDLIYEGDETWVTATGDDAISVLDSGVSLQIVNAISDWAAFYTIPSTTAQGGDIIVRIPEGANPNDYRIVAGTAIQNVGDFPQPRYLSSDTTYDYYLTPIAFLGSYAVGETLTLEHHGEEGHTSYVGDVPGIEVQIQDIRDDVAGKEDARPFDAFIDRNYYVRTNRDALTYHLQLHNIVPALLPDVDTLVILMRGGVVHNASFDPTASTDQVIPIELSTSEATNIATNVRDDTTIAIELSFRNGSTEVLRETIQIPVVAAPPRREEIDVLVFDLNRANDVDATLPANYAEWTICYLLMGDSTREDTHLIRTRDLAKGDLTNIGRGDVTYSWNSSTRVLSGHDSMAILYAVSLL